MTSDASQVTPARKLEALRQIRFLLDQGVHILVRDAGLTQREFEVLADEELIEVTFFRDEGPDLDRYHIESILPKGAMILARAAVAEPAPLRVDVVPRHKSVWRRIFESTRSGLWDLIKVGVGAVLGWYLKKYFP